MFKKLNSVFAICLLLAVFVFVSCGDGGKSSGEGTQPAPDGEKTSVDSDGASGGDNETPVVPGDDDNSGGQSGGGEAEPSDDSEPATQPDGDPAVQPDEAPVSDDDNPGGEETGSKKCRTSCESAADCVVGGANAFTDEDNYECRNGDCIYKGCLNDAECDAVYGAIPNKTYKCNPEGSYGTAECAQTCSTVGDCSAYRDAYGDTTEYPYDNDNYECRNGFCVYTGCNSDAECEKISSEYVQMKCVQPDYYQNGIRICSTYCLDDSDCGEAGRYECVNYQCVAKDCPDTEWCRANFGENFTCR